MHRKSVVSMDLALLTLEVDIRWGKGEVISEAWKVYSQLRENIWGIVIEIQSQHNFINIDFVLLWFISPKHFYNTLFRKYVVTNLNQLSAVSLDSIFYSLIKKNGILITVLRKLEILFIGGVSPFLDHSLSFLVHFGIVVL